MMRNTQTSSSFQTLGFKRPAASTRQTVGGGAKVLSCPTLALTPKTKPLQFYRPQHKRGMNLHEKQWFLSTQRYCVWPQPSCFQAPGECAHIQLPERWRHHNKCKQHCQSSSHINRDHSQWLDSENNRAEIDWEISRLPPHDHSSVGMILGHLLKTGCGPVRQTFPEVNWGDALELCVCEHISLCDCIHCSTCSENTMKSKAPDAS